MSSEILFKSPLGMIDRMNYLVENQINKETCFNRLSIPDMESLEKTKMSFRQIAKAVHLKYESPGILTKG